MRCKQTACPVPPADILISFPQAKKPREKVGEIKRQREKKQYNKAPSARDGGAEDVKTKASSSSFWKAIEEKIQKDSEKQVTGKHRGKEKVNLQEREGRRGKWR